MTARVVTHRATSVNSFGASPTICVGASANPNRMMGYWDPTHREFLHSLSIGHGKIPQDPGSVLIHRWDHPTTEECPRCAAQQGQSALGRWRLCAIERLPEWVIGGPGGLCGERP